MNQKVKLFLKIVITLVFVELLFFILMVLFSLSDEPVSPVGRFLGLLVENVIGFPLVLINHDFPLFFNSKIEPFYVIILIFTNLIIQAAMVFMVAMLIKYKICRSWLKKRPLI